MKIHEDDCPALNTIRKCEQHGFEIHPCTCHAPAAEQLRELVEAASEVVAGYDLSDDRRLTLALQPFRNQKGGPTIAK